MATGASISTIKAGLIAAYAAISLPGGLGVPTVIGREIDTTPATLPYIEIFTNPTRGITQPRGADSYEVTRPFIVRLYVEDLPDDTPSIENASYIKAENCAETVEDYFILTNSRLSVSGVIEQRVTADTGGVMLFTRANRNYAGIAFEHLITYYRQR